MDNIQYYFNVHPDLVPNLGPYILQRASDGHKKTQVYFLKILPMSTNCSFFHLCSERRSQDLSYFVSYVH